MFIVLPKKKKKKNLTNLSRQIVGSAVYTVQSVSSLLLQVPS